MFATVHKQNYIIIEKLKKITNIKKEIIAYHNLVKKISKNNKSFILFSWAH